MVNHNPIFKDLNGDYTKKTPEQLRPAEQKPGEEKKPEGEKKPLGEKKP